MTTLSVPSGRLSFMVLRRQSAWMFNMDIVTNPTHREALLCDETLVIDSTDPFMLCAKTYVRWSKLIITKG